MAKHELHPDSWVDQYSDLLLRYAIKRVPERDVAKDLVQDTFFTALRGKENFRGEISEKNWLFLILKSRILDHFKKKSEVLSSELAANNDEDDRFFDDKGHWLKDMVPTEWTTEKMVRNQEFQTVFEGCTDKLKESQRMVFTMKYLEDQDADEICKELNITSSNYWVLVHRAKLALRECIEMNWFNA